ncbi:MAG TPA: NADPH-dependent 7-cyano-7-deazaguanine reductase QueF [Casimicrobiaceae bacterium]|nr:NADPH-dependent 7-cyano-7-deazaguanine reductase QueF [Casimicrobiaceae bacterium]
MHRHPITSASSALGKPTDYPERYDPALLFTMPRAPQREALGIEGAPPFTGSDFWTAYEITWLDARGKPQLAVGRFEVPAASPRIVESKSLKLYLGSFASEKLDRRELARRVQSDLAKACDAAVTVELAPVTADLAAEPASPPGESLDDLELDADRYEPEPTLLEAAGPDVEETVHSALFRSRCPVTGQPDYGDVLVRYRGPRIDRSGLLRYLISYRRHPAFHESCVEQMFVDVLERCSPRELTVYARFLRRGGIEINPFRSNFEPAPRALERTVRQ